MRIPFTWRDLGIRRDFVESRTLDVVRKMGGNFLLKLNIGSRPIANKYREGKMKSTLERGLKVPEIAKREANETSFFLRDCCRLRWISVPQGQWFDLDVCSASRGKSPSCFGWSDNIAFHYRSALVVHSVLLRSFPRYRNAVGLQCVISWVKVSQTPRVCVSDLWWGVIGLIHDDG